MILIKQIGKSVPKQESQDKVTGRAKYTDDKSTKHFLSVRLVKSPYAHARIININISEALAVSGVHAVLTGRDVPILTGESIQDRPPLAIDTVRYHGEAVALVVADNEAIAAQATYLVNVTYEPLPVVQRPSEAIRGDVPLIHPKLGDYHHAPTVYPEPGTNIANRTKIRKGDIQEGWRESEVVVETTVAFPPSDHAAMETRVAIAEIKPTGEIQIISSTQSPFLIKKLMHEYFDVPIEKTRVVAPLVGGAFGGKAPVQLELLAYLASKSVHGRRVKIVNTREDDMITSPGHIGLEAKVKLGATKKGLLKAAEITLLFESGAYADKAPDISKSGAIDCTGPYHIENVWCDSLCVYTNHPYATSFRGFAHPELTFAMERAMEVLSKKCGMDPFEFRRLNAIRPGQTTPTQTVLTESNIGNTGLCLERVKDLIQWDEGHFQQITEHVVRAKGLSALWKTSDIDTTGTSGAILIFNSDGTVNLICGVVEIGTGTKTVVAQIVAERLKIDVSAVHVHIEVDTDTTPEHWKTVASQGTYMAGRAVLDAANDALNQLFNRAALALQADPEELATENGILFIKGNPTQSIKFSDIAYGYKYPSGNAVGGQIIGRGEFVLKHLTTLDQNTGKGNPGPEWTVGAQAVEVELNLEDGSYKLIKAATVIDAGKVLNRKGAEAQVMGAMSIGLSFATREGFVFNRSGQVLNRQLRNYHLIRFGENPHYLVDFVETPFQESAYGARGIGEHGVIGMPAALANALSHASGVELVELPLIPEYIWRKMRGSTS